MDHRPCHSARPGVLNRLLQLLLVTGLAVFAAGCGTNGNLTPNPLGPTEAYAVAGKLSIAYPVESTLMASTRGDLITVTDFSKFLVSFNGVASYAARAGNFSLPSAAYAPDLMIRAQAGKVVLLRRVYPYDLRYTNVSNLAVDLDTTARALIWKRGAELGKELTAADIAARGYENLVASVTQGLKFALQLPPSSVPGTILDLDIVKRPVETAARAIEAREAILREAHQVLYQALLRHDADLIAYYISPDFGNDWDISSNYAGFMAATRERFRRYEVLDCTTKIIDLEFAPDNLARMRASAQITVRGRISGVNKATLTYTADVWWRKEGSFWKIYRNLPYATTHPTEPQQDARWGEILTAMQSLRHAVLVENADELASGVSEIFGNDFDASSTKANLLLTARSRFNRTDVEFIDFGVENMSFPYPDVARVLTHAQVKVINTQLLGTVDSGVVRYEVTWQREQDGRWRIVRNLPYLWWHPHEPPVNQR